jgi:hypothetical protein
MLRETSPRVTKCLNKAVEARLLYDAETDPDKRLICLHIEQSLSGWLTAMNSWTNSKLS